MRLDIAAAFILKGKKILLIKRPDDTELFPGHWTGVGGRMKHPGEPLKEVVKREVKEEVGLDFEPTEPIYFGETIEKGIHNIGHGFLGNWSGNIKLNKKEVTKCGWFTYEEARKLPLGFAFPEIIKLLHKRKIL